EEAPVLEPAGSSRPWQLLTLSARTATALETTTKNLAEHLKKKPDINLADLAYTYQVGRRVFNHRRLLVCRTIEDAIAMLETPEPKRVFSNLQETEAPSVVFMFPGQGAQYVNMGLDLYRRERIFREQVDLCCDLLKPYLDLDLRQILFTE